MSLVDYQSSSEDSEDDTSEKPKKISFHIPPTSKRKEPVKISLPAFADAEDDEPVNKKSKPKPSSGLLNMLPAPKFASGITKPAHLVPYTVSKKKTTDISISKPSLSKLLLVLPSPKNVKAEKVQDDSEISSTNDFFSLETSAPAPPPAASTTTSEFSSEESVSSTSSSFLPQYSAASSKSYAMSSYEPVSNYSYADASTSETSSSNYSPIAENYSNYSSSAEPGVQSTSSPSLLPDVVNDERFQRLQHKKVHGLEDINIIDINADNLVSDKTDWHIKSVTEEKKVMHSRKKNEMPTHTQRRKHQITYLAFQAKERELDLKNNWAQNRLTKQQTQSKYGF